MAVLARKIDLTRDTCVSSAGLLLEVLLSVRGPSLSPSPPIQLFSYRVFAGPARLSLGIWPSKSAKIRERILTSRSQCMLDSLRAGYFAWVFSTKVGSLLVTGQVARSLLTNSSSGLTRSLRRVRRCVSVPSGYRDAAISCRMVGAGLAYRSSLVDDSAPSCRSTSDRLAPFSGSCSLICSQIRAIAGV